MYIFIAADAAEWQVLFTIEKQTKQNKKQANFYIIGKNDIESGLCACVKWHVKDMNEPF